MASATEETTPSQTRVVNVKKMYLNKMGYKDFQEWNQDPNNVYIGRNMSFYVPGANGSKWQNPFHVKKHGRNECVKMYKDHVKYDMKKYDGKTLAESLDELEGKTLGCWCHPEACHGHVLMELLKERKLQKESKDDETPSDTPLKNAEDQNDIPDLSQKPTPDLSQKHIPGLDPKLLEAPKPSMSKSAKKNAKRREKQRAKACVYDRSDRTSPYSNYRDDYI